MSLALTPAAYIASIDADADALARAALAAPGARIEACPDWDNNALARHMGDVFHFAAAQVRAAADEMTAPDWDHEPDDLTWLRHGAADIVAALSDREPDQPSWSWAGVATTSFYFRRMASEVAVHRVDAQRAAAGEVDPIGSDVAADAVDEVIEVGMAHTLAGPNHDFPAGSLHLHRTDGEGEWLLVAVDGHIELTREHAKGDAAVRGPASDLLLFLWGRGRGGAEVYGDESVALAWAAVAP